MPLRYAEQDGAARCPEGPPLAHLSASNFSGKTVTLTRNEREVLSLMADWLTSTEMLARAQFALTISFHYIYPPLSIGLGLLMVIMEALYLKTGEAVYFQMTRFWVTIFALIFGIGVATGIVMEFEFGTNWATYSRYVGDVFGSTLAAEGLFAFFLESGFLAILVFGWNKVSKKIHFLSTVMVALGAMFSAVWIVIANSWQQTPAGFHIVEHAGMARAEITDFWAMIFNPSSMERLAHTLGGAWLAGATLVLSVSAWYLLKNRHVDMAGKGLKIGLVVALFASLFQLATGDMSATGVAENQPAKLAAFEGVYKTGPADLTVLGWVDEKEKEAKGLQIPNGLSFLIRKDLSQPPIPVKGLNDIPADERPPVQLTFQSFHLMIMIGFGLIGLTLLGIFYWWRGKLFETRWLLWLFVLSVLGPQLANQAGWWTAEVGRQPWIVWGLLRTSEGLSKAVTANQILGSLIGFTLIYLLLFALFVYLLDRKIRRGPMSLEELDAIHPPGGKVTHLADV